MWRLQAQRRTSERAEVAWARAQAQAEACLLAGDLQRNLLVIPVEVCLGEHKVVDGHIHEVVHRLFAQ